MPLDAALAFPEALAEAARQTDFLLDSLLVVPEGPEARDEYVGGEARQVELAGFAQRWRWMSWLQSAGFWSEVITMLFNGRRRALHDYLGGTVVVEVAPGHTVVSMVNASG